MAAAGQHELWLKWIDALIDFEGVLGRSSLLGIRWDSHTSQGELPFVLLRGSTLTVLGENPAWMVSGMAGRPDGHCGAGLSGLACSRRSQFVCVCMLAHAHACMPVFVCMGAFLCRCWWLWHILRCAVC